MKQRFHRKCDCCGRSKYLPFRPEKGEHFLCDTCDDEYIAWKNKPGRDNFWMSDFLRSTVAKTCKANRRSGKK